MHGFAGLSSLGLDDGLGAFEDGGGGGGRGADGFIVADGVPVGLLLAPMFDLVFVDVLDELGEVLRREAALGARVQVFHTPPDPPESRQRFDSK